MSENDQAYYQGQYAGNQQPSAQRYQGGMSKDYTVDMVFCIDATGSIRFFSEPTSTMCFPLGNKRWFCTTQNSQFSIRRCLHHRRQHLRHLRRTLVPHRLLRNPWLRSTSLSGCLGFCVDGWNSQSTKPKTFIGLAAEHMIFTITSERIYHGALKKLRRVCCVDRE